MLVENIVRGGWCKVSRILIMAAHTNVMDAQLFLTLP